MIDLGYKERLEKIMKETSNLELINNIINSLNYLYSEDENGVKRLPDNLKEYSDSLSVAYSQALELQKRLEDGKVYEVMEFRPYEGNYSKGTFSTKELAEEYKNKKYGDDEDFGIITHVLDGELRVSS